jgi:hypothetical protein
MRKQSSMRRGRCQRRVLLKLALLMLPALFWSTIFMTMAGVRPWERVLERVPDTAQLLVALVCPLSAVMLGLATLRQNGETRGGESLTLSRVTFAAGVALVVFAFIAALRPA